MTPQERKLVTELFDRLATLEDAEREEDAVNVINAGLDRAPNALYALVQTVLLQDEALKRADARIQELEQQTGGEPPRGDSQGGFLDNMRDSLFGRREERGSVPTVRASSGGGAGAGGAAAWGPGYNQSANPSAGDRQPLNYGPAPHGQGAQPQQPMPQQPSGGGSFLGTAAATVAGVVGGAMLAKSLGGMFGGQPGQQGQSQGALNRPGGENASPWGSDSRNSDLARDAGLGDIGGGNSRQAAHEPGSQRQGMFDSQPAGHDASDHPISDDGSNDYADGSDYEFEADDSDPGDFGGDN